MLPLAFRNDGFTTYFRKPDMTRETLEQEYIDVLSGTRVRYLGWGAGPSSVFCYDTEVGELSGAGLTEKQWRIFRKEDRWVHRNLRRLIDSGCLSTAGTR